jgi:hypothetical protein
VVLLALLFLLLLALASMRSTPFSTATLMSSFLTSGSSALTWNSSAVSVMSTDGAQSTTVNASLPASALVRASIDRANRRLS